MTYQTGAAFRRALEDRLLAQSHQTDVSLVRLRKLVAFDRFLARLTQGRHSSGNAETTRSKTCSACTAASVAVPWSGQNSRS